MADSEDITHLVEQFMAVTGADDTVAMCYLHQSGWNIQVIFKSNLSQNWTFKKIKVSSVLSWYKYQICLFSVTVRFPLFVYVVPVIHRKLTRVHGLPDGLL